MTSALGILDCFYAESLGCAPEVLRRGGVGLIEGDLTTIWYAKGSPLVLYALATGSGAVVCVQPEFRTIVDEVMAEEVARGSGTLDVAACLALEQALTPLVDVDFWFSGVRLYCESKSFVDRSSGHAREITPDEDERAHELHRRWGGKVFGEMVEGRFVSWAVVKPLSELVWDLSIETLIAHRGQGHAASAVSAALKHVFTNGRLAGWGCDRTSVASIRTARSVGFEYYGFDFGCVGRIRC